jgi:site-specific recombinase XerD
LYGATLKKTVDKEDVRIAKQITTASETPMIVSDSGNSLPVLVARSGSAAQFAWEEFIYGKIRNPHTRAAYERAIRRFLDHCDSLNKQLPTVSPRDVGSYLDEQDYAPATKKLHLSAIRHFFDTLVTRHVIMLNPAHSVRGERLQVVEGKTPEITVPQARRLMQSLDTSHLVGLRDRAIIAIMIYTAARVGAVATLRRGDFYDLGDEYCLRFAEKGGMSREIPVRHDLKQFIGKYLAAGGMEYADKSKPLFRTTIRKTKKLTQNTMTAGDMARMVKRRMRDESGKSHAIS